MSIEQLFLNELDLGDLGVIYQPSIEDIIKLSIKERVTSEDVLNGLIIPFLIDFSKIISNDSESKMLRNNLVYALMFFYKTDNVQYDENGNFFITNENYKDKYIVINKYNFDLLSHIIKKVFFMVEKKQEDREIVVQNSENNELLQEYLRLQEEAKKDKEEQMKRNAVSLSEIITFVAKDTLWDYDKVLKMTYFRLIHTYKTITRIDNYSIYIRYLTSGQFDLKNYKQKHWTEELKEDLR